MKNNELFDLLGEIDDKFYEEAREELPQEPTVIRLNERGSKKALLRNIAVTAACLAVVAAAGTAIALRGGNGTLTPDSQTASYADITESDILECKELAFNSGYSSMLPDMTAGDSRIFWGERVMDLNFDGNYEVVIILDIDFFHYADGKESVFVFNKTADGMKLTGEFKRADGLESLEQLYPYESGGEKFYYYPTRVADGDLRHSAVNVVLFDEESETYRSEAAIFCEFSSGGYFLPEFFKLKSIIVRSDDLYESISEQEFRELWAKYPELPEIYIPEYKGKADFLFEGYPHIDTQDIPDIPGNAMLTGRNGECLPKATLYTADIGGGYDLHLLADYIHTDKSSDDLLHCGKYFLGLSKDGKELSIARFQFQTLSMGQGEYKLPMDKYHAGINLMSMDDGLLIIATYDYDAGASSESIFLTIKNDKLYSLMGDFSGIGGASLGSCANLSNNLSCHANTLYDLENDIVYEIDFDAVSDEFTKPHFNARHADKLYDEYPDFDFNSNTPYTSATLDTKQCGAYTFKLLAHDAKASPAEDFPLVSCSNVIIRVEQNGRIIAEDTVYNIIGGSHLNGSMLGDYLRPFEMSGGMGFILYSQLDPYMNGYQSCYLYVLNDDGFKRLGYYNPKVDVVGTDSDTYKTTIDETFAVNFNENIINDGNRHIKINFESEYFCVAAGGEAIGGSGLNFNKNDLLDSADYGDYHINVLGNGLYVFPDDLNRVYTNEHLTVMLQSKITSELLGRYEIQVPDRALSVSKMSEGVVNVYEMDGMPLIMVAYPFFAMNSSSDGTLYEAVFYTIANDALVRLTGMSGGLPCDSVELWNYFTVSESEKTLSSYKIDIKFTLTASRTDFPHFNVVGNH